MLKLPVHRNRKRKSLGQLFGKKSMSDAKEEEYEGGVERLMGGLAGGLGVGEVAYSDLRSDGGGCVLRH